MLLCFLLAMWLSPPCLLKSLPSLLLRDSKYLKVEAAVSPYLPLLQQGPGSDKGRVTDLGRMDGQWQNGGADRQRVGWAVLGNRAESQRQGLLELYGEQQAQGEVDPRAQLHQSRSWNLDLGLEPESCPL